MKRRDLLKGIVAVPAAIKAAKELQAGPKKLPVAKTYKQPEATAIFMQTYLEDPDMEERWLRYGKKLK